MSTQQESPLTPPVPSDQRQPPVPPIAPRSWTAGRVIAVVIGSIAALVSLVLLAAGGALAWATATQRDSDGYFTSRTERFSTPTPALTAEGIDLGREPRRGDWGADLGDLVQLRIRVESASTDSTLFVGVARQRDLDQYLAGTAHDEIADVDVDPFRVGYDRRPGVGTASPPAGQGFWVATASGTGPQELVWEAESGDWALFVGNADGSPGVDIRASVGARISYLWPVAIGLLIGALLIGLLAVFLVVTGSGTGHRVAQSRDLSDLPPGFEGRLASAVAPVLLEGRVDPLLSRWMWLVKWILAIPHFVVLCFLWAANAIVTFIAGIIILFTGRYPRAMFDFSVGVLRWSWRVAFYATGALASDRYPPFSLSQQPGDHATLDVVYPERLSLRARPCEVVTRHSAPRDHRHSRNRLVVGQLDVDGLARRLGHGGRRARRCAPARDGSPATRDWPLPARRVCSHHGPATVVLPRSRIRAAAHRSLPAVPTRPGRTRTAEQRVGFMTDGHGDAMFDALIPSEMARRAEGAGVAKAAMPIGRVIPLSILGGAFIALGAMFFTVVTAGDDLPAGVARFLGGTVFSLGLVLVVVGGAELFTGNALVVMALASRRIRVRSLARTWALVYVGNFVGAMSVAMLVVASGQLRRGDGTIGVRALNIAGGKTDLSFGSAVASGILANTLVCLAVWLSLSARSTTDRIIAIVPPVSAFVAGGFEHSIANMYLMPVALLHRSWAPDGFWTTTGAPRVPQLTWGRFLTDNLVPVTLGNLIGGTALVGIVYWLVYRPDRTSA